MPFFTAGDPDLATTAQLLTTAHNAGAAICELGFPFSDPIADGPVISASMARALDRGLRVSQIFDLVSQQRAKLPIGLVAMVSYSIVRKMGEKTFVSTAKQAGFDGFIFPDLPLEESASMREHCTQAGLICSMLIAPTTPIERARRIAQASSGFVYLLARSGITGESDQLPAELPDRVRGLRETTDLPIAVGFGVSSGQQVRQVVEFADAAIVGSAIVRRIQEHADQGSAAVIQGVDSFIRELAGGLTVRAAG